MKTIPIKNINIPGIRNLEYKIKIIVTAVIIVMINKFLIIV